jgi:hypothetical protein
MNELSRPATLDDLKALLRSFNQRQVDYLLIGGETYETLQQFAETIDLDGIPVRTVSLEGLLRTKQTMRDKDIADRTVLERAIEALNKDNHSPR